MSVPLYEQLFQHIIDEIRAGRLTVGDRVPSEKELADQFNVSRITSKKALEMLHQAGIIERMRGKGSFVAAMPPLDDGQSQTAAETSRLARSVIGVIVPDFSDAYALKMVHTIEETCAESDLFVVIKRTYGSQQVEKKAIHALTSLGVAGLIVFPVHGEYYNPELLRLVLSGFPIVLVDRRLKGISASSVYTDNLSASQRLTRYLLDKGHKHIAFISPPAENTTTIEERIEGYQAALHERHLNGDHEHILSTLYSTLPTAFDAEHIHQDSKTLTQYIAAHPQISAYIACEYNLAMLLDRALVALDLEREIVCFDSPDSPLVPPRFTHIKQDEEMMGRTAVNILLAHINGSREMQTVTVDFRFVEAQTKERMP